MKRFALVSAAAALALLSGPAIANHHEGGGAAHSIATALDDPLRPEADTARDQLRKPGEVIAFAGVEPGMTVIDYAPGGG
jgi:predicted methyltransferase